MKTFARPIARGYAFDPARQWEYRSNEQANGSLDVRIKINASDIWQWNMTRRNQERPNGLPLSRTPVRNKSDGGRLKRCGTTFGGRHPQSRPKVFAHLVVNTAKAGKHICR
jgi:hypothetical protein